MGFRFRKRLRLGPFALNLSKQGLSSLSFGRPGATVNIPLARDGQTRTTVGLPGSGLSYSHEGSKQRSVRERQQQQRHAPEIPSTEETIQEVMTTLCGPDCVGDALWRQGLLQMVIDYDDTPRNVREAAYLIRSADAVELHLRRARGAAATRAASMEIIRAVQTVLAWTQEMGWSEPGEG